MVANSREGRAGRGSPNIGPLSCGCSLRNLLVDAIVQKIGAIGEVELVDFVAHRLKRCRDTILPFCRSGEKYKHLVIRRANGRGGAWRSFLASSLVPP